MLNLASYYCWHSAFKSDQSSCQEQVPQANIIVPCQNVCQGRLQCLRYPGLLYLLGNTDWCCAQHHILQCNGENRLGTFNTTWFGRSVHSDRLDDGALKGHISVAILLQHLVVGNFVSTLHVAMAILHVVLRVGKAETELAAGEVRHKWPPRDSHPGEPVGSHRHDLEKPLQVVGMLQIHFGSPPRPTILHIHHQQVKSLLQIKTLHPIGRRPVRLWFLQDENSENKLWVTVNLWVRSRYTKQHWSSASVRGLSGKASVSKAPAASRIFPLGLNRIHSWRRSIDHWQLRRRMTPAPNRHTNQE